MKNKSNRMAATIQIRISTEDKNKLKKILTKQGLTISAAVRMFLMECIRLDRLPFTYTGGEIKK
jgi:addiction module RelB/DinJ family antitoxin